MSGYLATGEDVTERERARAALLARARRPRGLAAAPARPGQDPHEPALHRQPRAAHPDHQHPGLHRDARGRRRRRARAAPVGHARPGHPQLPPAPRAGGEPDHALEGRVPQPDHRSLPCDLVASRGRRTPSRAGRPEARRRPGVRDRRRRRGALGRRRPAAADARQPAHQRDQVHRARRPGRRRAAHDRRSRPCSSSRTPASASRPTSSTRSSTSSSAPRWPGDREIQGTGLGLSIVRAIVDLHRGTVTVDSTPGSGSRFEVTLPLAGPDDDRQGLPAIRRDARAGRPCRRRMSLAADLGHRFTPANGLQRARTATPCLLDRAV